MGKGEDESLMTPAMRQRTTPRLQASFLRHFARSGSQAEAAARCGITARSVRRWRANDPRFAHHYEKLMSLRMRLPTDEDSAIDGRSVFRRRRLTAVERCNDVLLMHLLARADRLRAIGARRESPLQADIRTPARRTDQSMDSEACAPRNGTPNMRHPEARSVRYPVALRTS